MAIVSDKIDNKIATAFKEADPRSDKYIVDMFTRWIAGGLISNQGRYIATDISHCKMTVKNYESARFTCHFTARVAPDFKKSATVKYTWTLKGRNYHGEFSEL